jgi:hypothetical protein
MFLIPPHHSEDLSNNISYLDYIVIKIKQKSKNNMNCKNSKKNFVNLFKH